MVKLEYISDKQAIKLKEKGYPMFRFQTVNKKQYFGDGIGYSYSKDKTYFVITPSEISKTCPNEALDMFYRPKLEEVIKWLRDEKDIIILPQYSLFWEDIMYEVSDIINHRGELIASLGGKRFCTVEAALSSAIDKVIDLL